LYFGKDPFGVLPLILILVVAERYERQLLGDVQAFGDGGKGHVKMPQLRNLLGDLPIYGNLR